MTEEDTESSSEDYVEESTDADADADADDGEDSGGGSQSGVSMRPGVDLDIGMTLKRILEEDYNLINHHNRVIYFCFQV